MEKEVMDFILERALKEYPLLSDILFTPYHPLEVLEHGRLNKIKLDGLNVLSPFQIESIALYIIGNRRRLLKDLVKTGSCDLPYQINNVRFRVNIFSQRTGYAIVMRKLPSEVPTIDHLKLPSIFYEIAKEVSGIVLVTGPTGSGKSTSIAALLEEINHNRYCHIITLEDPIEFIFTSEKATFNQRELGTDFSDFASGLRAALRQAPHIIMVGEMRDSETVKVALSAAETGHLVLSTLHTSYASQTIFRIIDMVGEEEKHFVRARLAGSLKWIICQRLIPRLDGGRIAIFDILYNNLMVREAILQEKNPGFFYEIMKKRTFGMQTFDQELLSLYERGLIDEITAITYASHRSVVRQGIDKIKVKRGEPTTDLKDLSLEEEKEEKIGFI
ncbi:MAG: PilT/PilU family type 4a pilus ATPase [Deltaproteobacteria bacterium]|nr:PilT/PilU family type 4a pilus ATPase [Deltaproteobacteria bacterium]